MNLNNNYVKINGEKASEFDMNAYVAAYYNVPVVFVSGDEQLCYHAKQLIPEIETAGVKWGWGNATVSVSPKEACNMIRDGVIKGLAKLELCTLASPSEFNLEINFKECVHALRASFYPGACQLDERSVSYTAKDIQEMMTARMFML